MGVAQSSAGKLMTRKGPLVPPAAATVMMAAFEDDSVSGFRVAMIKRPSTMKFMPNLYTFPGGRVDDADVVMSSDTEEVPNVFSHGPDRIAALREMCEEIGLTLNREGAVSNTDYTRFSPAGARLLVPFQRWVTPRQQEKRFDTIFFLFQARPDVPEKYRLIPNPGEVEEAIWITPQEALLRQLDPTSGFKMPPPVYLMMHKLCTYRTPGPALHEHQIAWATNMSRMPVIQPEQVIAPDGAFELHLPGNVLHLFNGTHEFPGNFTPKALLPEGLAAPPKVWRVVHGSPLWDSMTYKYAGPDPVLRGAEPMREPGTGAKL